MAHLTDRNQGETRPISSHRTVRRNAHRLLGQKIDLRYPQAIDQLSHEACPWSLFLVTVADAQGLRFDSERALCQRLSMTPAVLRQARQALIAYALVAYQDPLSQVLALDREALRPTAERPTLPLPGDDDPVDLKAVFKQIWEGLS